jgi:type I restriction enzyme R subunit
MDNIEGVFVDKLETNLHHINSLFNHIRNIFTARGINNFERLPDAREDRNMFAKDFSKMSHLLEAVKLQGFVWEQDTYEFKHEQAYARVRVELDEHTYLVLLQRYRELFVSTPGPGQEPWEYEIDTYITETGVGTIDAEYINSKFIKFVKNLYTSGVGSEHVKAAQAELHNAFASLNQRDQRTAQRILHDIESGDLRLSPGKTIYDYILDYQKRECDKQVFTLSEATGISFTKLNDLFSKDVNEQNINEQGRFEELIRTIDKGKAVDFLKKVTGQDVPKRFVMSNMSSIVRRFILDPADRAKIIYAYQDEESLLDVNIPDELPEKEEQQETPEQQQHPYR